MSPEYKRITKSSIFLILMSKFDSENKTTIDKRTSHTHRFSPPIKPHFSHTLHEKSHNNFLQIRTIDCSELLQKIMGLECVGGLAMHVILSKSGPVEAASVACLGKRFRAWASDDMLWAQFCSHELGLTSPLDPHDNLAPSFKVLLRSLYFFCQELSWVFI